MSPDMFAFSVGFTVGGLFAGALVWHFKDIFVAIGRRSVSLFLGAKYMAGKAQQDVTSLEQKLAAAKAAVSK